MAMATTFMWAVIFAVVGPAIYDRHYLDSDRDRKMARPPY